MKYLKGLGLLWIVLCIGCQETTPVISQIETITYAIEEQAIGERIWCNIEVFNDKGQKIMTQIKGANDFILSEATWYYENDLLVKIENENNGRLFTTVMVYEENRMISEHRYREHTLLSYTLYDYESNIKTTKEYDQDDVLMSFAQEEIIAENERRYTTTYGDFTVILDSQGRKQAVNHDDGHTEFYIYNEQGQVIETFVDENDIWTYDYTYNDEGDYISKKSFFNGELTVYEERVIEYDN